MACLIRVVLTQSCYEMFLLPFTSWFPRHQVVALQLLAATVAVSSSTRPGCGGDGPKVRLQANSISLLSLFSRFPIFDSRPPRPSCSHAPSSDRPKPKAKLRPHQPLPPKGIHCLCHYCTKQVTLLHSLHAWSSYPLNRCDPAVALWVLLSTSWLRQA